MRCVSCTKEVPSLFLRQRNIAGYIYIGVITSETCLASIHTYSYIFMLSLLFPFAFSKDFSFTVFATGITVLFRSNLSDNKSVTTMSQDTNALSLHSFFL